MFDLSPLYEEVGSSPHLLVKRRQGLRRKTFADPFFPCCVQCFRLRKRLHTTAPNRLWAVRICATEKLEIAWSYNADRVWNVRAVEEKDHMIFTLVFFALCVERWVFTGCRCSSSLREGRVATVYFQVLIDECGRLARGKHSTIRVSK